jgi:hypothetical protein|tara:strand:- start:22 stop:255 length:234 start_codon:yes stop_codon:yes gene_type:complete
MKSIFIIFALCWPGDEFNDCERYQVSGWQTYEQCSAWKARKRVEYSRDGATMLLAQCHAIETQSRARILYPDVEYNK